MRQQSGLSAGAKPSKVVTTKAQQKQETESLISLLTGTGAAYEKMANTGQMVFLKVVSAVMENNDSIMIADPDGKIEYVNKAFENMTGYHLAELIGRSPSVLKSGKESQKFYENMWKTILAGKVFRAEFVNKSKDGALYYQQETIIPVKGADGSIAHFVATGRDVTEERREANHLTILGKIAVPIIDQIHTPIRQVQSAAVSLRDYVLKQKDLQPYKDLEKIYVTSKQIEKVLHTLSKFIRPNSPPYSHVELRQVLEAACEQLQGGLEDHNAKINLDIADKISIVEINPSEWQFIFFQLMVHALDGLPAAGFNEDMRPFNKSALEWTVRQHGHELEFMLVSKSSKLLNQIPLVSERYSRIHAGNVDLELLLAEKIIGDYGATISYQLTEDKQRTVILLPQSEK